MFTRLTWLASSLLLAVMFGIPTGMAAEFVPGHIADWDVNICQKYGGIPLTKAASGNNQDQTPNRPLGCALGEVLATYRCDNTMMISVIARPNDHSLLHWTGSHVELANLQTMGGAHWVGKRVVLWERGLAARVVTENGELLCQKL